MPSWVIFTKQEGRRVKKTNRKWRGVRNKITHVAGFHGERDLNKKPFTHLPLHNFSIVMIHSSFFLFSWEMNPFKVIHSTSNLHSLNEKVWISQGTKELFLRCSAVNPLLHRKIRKKLREIVRKNWGKLLEKNWGKLLEKNWEKN